MLGFLHKRDRCPGLAVWLAVLALGLRIALPTGVMLAAPSQGTGPQVVICTGQGAMTVSLTADGQLSKGPGEKGQNKPDRPDHPCAFAATTALAQPSLFQTIAPTAILQRISQPLAPAQRPGLGLAAPPPWTTGPPSDFRLI
jgi:hypothetical protein